MLLPKIFCLNKVKEGLFVMPDEKIKNAGEQEMAG